jgi:DNA-binding GntR family transcriptional regulator
MTPTPAEPPRQRSRAARAQPSPAAGSARRATRKTADRGLRRYISSDLGYGSAAGAVTDALREAILDGVLAPGTWLREADLAAELGVSRTPVREAITRLHNEGLVSRTASSGAVVASLSLEDIIAVYAVRESLEATAARLVASIGNASLVDGLNDIHERMVRAVDKPNAGQKLAELNLLFHAEIREATGNAYLRRFLIEVEHAVRRFQRSGYDDPEHMRRTIDEHRRIIEAIAARDPDLAGTAAAEHMRSARQMRIRDLLPELSGSAQGARG